MMSFCYVLEILFTLRSFSMLFDIQAHDQYIILLDLIQNLWLSLKTQ